VQAGETCPDQPYPASVEVVGSVGQSVVRLTANALGVFAIALPEGDYTLVASATGEAPLPWAEPVEVVVRSGEWTDVEILMDSGIR
jgi:hypothetical protein